MLRKNREPCRELERIFLDQEALCFAMALDILKEPDLAEDILHEVFLALLPKSAFICGLPPQEAKAYIYICVKNRALDRQRRRRRELLELAAYPWAQLVTIGGQPGKIATRAERGQIYVCFRWKDEAYDYHLALTAPEKAYRGWDDLRLMAESLKVKE